MTKVEINGKTYCVETLIYTVERLTKEVKANAEYNRLALDYMKKYYKDVLDQIEEEINSPNRGICDYFIIDRIEEIINKYKTESEKE